MWSNTIAQSNRQLIGLRPGFTSSVRFPVGVATRISKGSSSLRYLALPFRMMYRSNVSVQLPVWNRRNVAIVQSRNVSATQETDQDFDPQFGATSDPISDDKPNQAALAATVGLPVFTDVPRSCSVDFLVSKILQPQLISQSDDWKRFPLSVTVFHEQILTFDGSRQPGSDVEFAPEAHQFPLLNFRFRPDVPSDYTQQLNWFSLGISDFRIDFQWSSPCNLQFLRLSTIRVQVP
jgi:hypothetical protein